MKRIQGKPVSVKSWKKFKKHALVVAANYASNLNKPVMANQELMEQELNPEELKVMLEYCLHVIRCTPTAFEVLEKAGFTSPHMVMTARKHCVEQAISKLTLVERDSILHWREWMLSREKAPVTKFDWEEQFSSKSWHEYATSKARDETIYVAGGGYKHNKY